MLPPLRCPNHAVATHTIATFRMRSRRPGLPTLTLPCVCQSGGLTRRSAGAPTAPAACATSRPWRAASRTASAKAPRRPKRPRRSPRAKHVFKVAAYTTLWGSSGSYSRSGFRCRRLEWGGGFCYGKENAHPQCASQSPRIAPPLGPVFCLVPMLKLLVNFCLII